MKTYVLLFSSLCVTLLFSQESLQKVPPFDPVKFQQKVLKMSREERSELMRKKNELIDDNVKKISSLPVENATRV